MKCFDKFRLRMVLFICVAVVALSGIYTAGALYLDSNIGRFSQFNFAGQDKRGNQYVNRVSNSQEGSVSVRSLPNGWRADWVGGKLWIKHYNPNGTVADALPFNSLKDLYRWLDTHPDCCDVDVNKLARERTKAEGIYTASNPDTTAPATIISDKLGASVKAAE